MMVIDCRWVAREKTNTVLEDGVKFQTDYVADLVKDCGADYPYDLDVSETFYEWLEHKRKNILTYRDQSFKCKFTGDNSDK